MCGSSIAIALVACALVLPASAQTNAPTPGFVRVRIDTSAGSMILALDTRRAPRTSTVFLAYVDDGRFDGTSFYRAARRKTAPGFGFVQGGIRTDARRILPPVPHEPTNKTGIRHLDATVSMARGGAPGTAGGNFFITVGPTPNMDAAGSSAGYAAFGRVVGGMDTVRRILQRPTGGGMDAMKGQMILAPIKLIRARRLDGVARPTGRPKPWLFGVRRPTSP